MKKSKFRHIIAILAGLVVILSFSSFGNAAGPAEKEQFGTVEGAKVTSEPEEAQIKKNICRNPKLCESIEIDLLDNLQKSKLPAVLPGLEASAATQDYKVALNLGLTVTDALAAIVNKDKTAFLKCIGMINDYAKKLGTPEIGNLTASAEKGEWNKLGTSIYNYKDATMTALDGKNQQGNATLMMVSGGLEGLFIVAKSVDSKFSEDSAAMLRSKELVQFLEKYTKSLSADLKEKEEVKAIIAALPKINKIVDKDKAYKYSKADVKELLNIYEPLRQNLVK